MEPGYSEHLQSSLTEKNWNNLRCKTVMSSIQEIVKRAVGLDEKKGVRPQGKAELGRVLHVFIYIFC